MRADGRFARGCVCVRLLFCVLLKTWSTPAMIALHVKYIHLQQRFHPLSKPCRPLETDDWGRFLILVSLVSLSALEAERAGFRVWLLNDQSRATRRLQRCQVTKMKG
jgi:hypothetical protein